MTATIMILQILCSYSQPRSSLQLLNLKLANTRCYPGFGVGGVCTRPLDKFPVQFASGFYCDIERRFAGLQNGNLLYRDWIFLRLVVLVNTGSSMKSKQYSNREKTINMFLYPTFHPGQTLLPEPHPVWP
jgi:hypothetical protein